VIKSRVASLALRMAGWEFEGQPPSIKKYVCLAVPHTSNWDGLLLVGVSQAIGLPMSFMIKREWVDGPLGPVMRRLGAVPIDRRGSHNIVDQMIEALHEHDELVLVIPPEGTRKRADHWRSGFYHIALGAGVPVVPGYLDFRRKRAGLGAPITLTGNVRADMDRIRAFYAEKGPTAYDPESYGPIALREESEPVAARP
jgi:1-acyl-sn-glycerol-3-phosphate acyltransferase